MVSPADSPTLWRDRIVLAITIVASVTPVAIGWWIEHDWLTNSRGVDIVGYAWGPQLSQSIIAAGIAGVGWGMHAGLRHRTSGSGLFPSPLLAWATACIGLTLGSSLYEVAGNRSSGVGTPFGWLPYFALVTALPAIAATAFTYSWWYVTSSPPPDEAA